MLLVWLVLLVFELLQKYGVWIVWLWAVIALMKVFAAARAQWSGDMPRPLNAVWPMMTWLALGIPILWLVSHLLRKPEQAVVLSGMAVLFCAAAGLIYLDWKGGQGDEPPLDERRGNGMRIGAGGLWAVLMLLVIAVIVL